MSKVYTFPTQQVLAGTLTFEVETSTGSGSQTLTEKYFSSQFKFVEETEFIGGDLKSAHADFTIEYDADNLFRETILPSALTEQGWVTVKVSLGSDVIYYGAVEPSTISYNPFYALNDALDGQYTSVTFRCTWVVSLAKFIPKYSASGNDLAGRMLSVSISGGKYLTNGASGSYLTNGYCYVTIRDVIDGVFYLLNSLYGFTYTINYELTDLVFFSKGDGVAGQSYLFPEISNYGDVDYCSFGGFAEPCLVLGQVNAVTAGLPSGVLGESGTLFYDTSDTTFNNAYEFLVGILKSLGLYCHIRHSSSVDLIVTIGTRVSGEEVLISNVLSSPETPMSEIARNKINVTSMQSGNSYVKEFPSIGTSEFSLQTPLDFGNDYDFPGTSDPVNSKKSLVYPQLYPVVGGVVLSGQYQYFELLRHITFGDNLLTNAQFTSDLSGWSVDAGAWAYNSGDPMGFGAGVARTAMNTLAGVMSQTLSESFYDGCIFGGWFRATTIPSGNIQVVLTLYSGSEVMKTEVFNITASERNIMLYTHYSATNARRLKSKPITKVAIDYNLQNSGGAGNYLYMDRMFMKKSRKGCPELVGMQVEDYFNNGRLTRKSKVLNGVLAGVSPRDYFTEDGTTYYIKKVAKDYQENETEIEAINYQ